MSILDTQRPTNVAARWSGPSARLALLLLLPLALLAASCTEKADAQTGPGGKGGPGAAAAVPVSLRPAEVRPVQRSVEVIGTLWGEEDATVSNKVPGKVIAIFKDVGDRAEPGEPLAQLLKNDYQLAKNQRESALNEVLAKLGVDAVPPEDFDISSLPSVSRARLQAENARSRFERGKQLHEQDPPLLSDQDFADLRTAYDVANSGFQVEQLTARALVTEARTRAAELAIANRALLDTTIRAPMPNQAGQEAGLPAGQETEGGPTQPAAAGQPAKSDGNGGGGESAPSFVVAARMVSVGELASAITPMFRVVDDDPLKLRAAVPERYVGQIKIDQKAGVRVEAFPDEVFAGRVARINPQIDPANRTFQVEILVPNADRRLRPGAFARARVETRVQPGVVFVPKEAVVTFAGVNKVFTVKDGKAVEVGVELGDRQGDSVEVTKGLKGSEPVVVSGTGRLATGVPVSVTPDQPAAAAGQPETPLAADGARKPKAN